MVSIVDLLREISRFLFYKGHNAPEFGTEGILAAGLQTVTLICPIVHFSCLFGLINLELMKLGQDYQVTRLCLLLLLVQNSKTMCMCLANVSMKRNAKEEKGTLT